MPDLVRCGETDLWGKYGLLKILMAFPVVLVFYFFQDGEVVHVAYFAHFTGFEGRAHGTAGFLSVQAGATEAAVI